MRHSAVPLPRQAALIERMAGLVDHPHDGGGEIILGIAGGDAHIVGHAAAEGMQAGVEAAMLELETHGAHNPLAEIALLLHREGAGQI